MRSGEEMLKRMESKEANFFGFDKEVILPFMEFKHVKSLLKEEVKNKEGAEKEWNDARLEYTPEFVLKQMSEYMKNYGWDKCLSHRGISAGRTVEKMEAWIWLLGDDETLIAVQEAPYENYGAPQLAVVCKKYNFPIPTGQDATNMINSLACEPGCENGCGS